jgi:hypothetical protein
MWQVGDSQIRVCFSGRYLAEYQISTEEREIIKIIGEFTAVY